MEHILIKLGSSKDLLQEVNLLDTQSKSEKLRVKEVVGLCTFLICKDEKTAKDYYKEFGKKFLTFP